MLQKLTFSVHNSTLTHPDAIGSINMVIGWKEHPTDILFMTNPSHPFWAMREEPGEPVRIGYVRTHQDGVYETNDFNFNHTMKNWADYTEVYGELNRDGMCIKTPELGVGWAEWFQTQSISQYGVADDVEQILERYKQAIDNPDSKIVISITRVCKPDQPDRGGWRWHKWGEYIGTQEITTEYLYHEPIVESVLCFHVYPVALK